MRDTFRVGSEEYELVPWHDVLDDAVLRPGDEERFLRPADPVPACAPAAPPKRRVRATVRIVEVLGLHRPDGVRDPGYKSQDDLGRIFINHRHDRGHARDVQYVDVTAEVTADGELPGDLRCVWEWEDPDDTSDAGAREDAARTLDPVEGPDNFGQCDHPTRFAALTGYAMTAPGETAVSRKKSRVRFHATNVGGDNFRLRVRLAPHPDVDTDGGDATGVMTMWKRIQVEYRRMPGARELPVEQVGRHFEKAFVQMEFTPPQPCPAKRFLSPLDSKLGEAADAYIAKNFRHAGRPGWFFLVAALEAAEDTREEISQDVYDGPAELDDNQLLVRGAPKELIDSDPTSVTLYEGDRSVKFWVSGKDDHAPAKGDSTILVQPHDYTPEFVPGDGSIPKQTDLYSPARLGFPARLDRIRVTAGGGASLGKSPLVRVGRRRYFAGRTIVFTHHPTFRDGDADARSWALKTIVHEFTHAFGLPHKCGQYDWRGPASTSCAMNYGGMWLYVPGTRELQRFVHGEVGPDLCARHLRAIREVHLEDNPALWKW